MVSKPDRLAGGRDKAADPLALYSREQRPRLATPAALAQCVTWTQVQRRRGSASRQSMAGVATSARIATGVLSATGLAASSSTTFLCVSPGHMMFALSRNHNQGHGKHCFAGNAIGIHLSRRAAAHRL